MKTGLDPDSVMGRIKSAGQPPKVRGFGNSLLIGGLGFGFVSVLVFAIWAFAGNWLASRFGEGGFYAVCAVAFIGLSGIVLDRIVIGPDSLRRFYLLFLTSFTAYSIVWCLAWFLLRRPGNGLMRWLTGADMAGLIGAFFGVTAMALIIARAFSVTDGRWRMIAILFLGNAGGYFAGDWLFAWFRSPAAATLLENVLPRASRVAAGMLAWGAAYGIGFGLGLGYLLYQCQAAIRKRLALESVVETET